MDESIQAELLALREAATFLAKMHQIESNHIVMECNLLW